MSIYVAYHRPLHTPQHSEDRHRTQRLSTQLNTAALNSEDRHRPLHTYVSGRFQHLQSAKDVMNSRTQSRPNTGTRQHPREILAALCSQHSGSQHSSTHRHRHTGLSARPLGTQAKASRHTGKGLSTRRSMDTGLSSRPLGTQVHGHRQKSL